MIRAAALAAILALSTASPAQASTQAPHEEQREVTLITGDTVVATKGSGPKWTLGLAGQAPAVPFRYRTFSSATGDQYLVPESADALVDSKQLDVELFNITGLIRQGYDDAHSDAVPLLVEQPGARSALGDLGLSALDESKKDVRRFWDRLTSGAPRTLSGGTKKVWLNGKVRASLDTSAPLVGAPAAWQAGHTGKGVTVAVLDTGIDGEHPDLRGKVAQAKDFTGGGSTADKAGHGTHVASTIAGSGSKYRGIAPDARLAVGKVLGDNGEGQFDDLIAGMQWAAAEVKAKVVNMSVGGFPSDGTDPLSMTLNTLSRKHNTLFVVAAGNAGEFGKHTVATPASADAALAVGNITRAGQVNERSSTGPRLGDGAVKPEISAPGTGIVAARAAGTGTGEEVEQHYVRKSGTSMAAPHVAAGAAILAGLHPDWSAERLKSALVGSATPLPEGNVFAVGSGKLDVHRAVTTTVRTSTASVHAFLPWGGKPVQEREVVYENTGSAPVTLALDLKLASAKVSATRVTVPANGTTKVWISFTRGTPGEHGGVLTASTVDGKVVVRTPVSVATEAEMYDLTLTMLDRDGKSGFGSGDVINLENGDRRRAGAGAKLRLPAGKYMISALIPTGGTSVTTVAFPEFTLTKASAVTLDARKANRVVVGTDRPSVRGGGVVTQVGARRPGDNTHSQMQLLFVDPRFTELYAGSEGSSPSFLYGNSARLSEPTLELFAEKPQRFEVNAQWLSTPAPDGTIRQGLAHVSTADVKGKLVVLEPPVSATPEELRKQVAAVKERGGVAAALRLTQGQRSAAEPFALPTVEIAGPTADRLVALAKNGGGETALTSRSNPGPAYELTYPESGRIPEKPVYQAKTAEMAAVTMAFHGVPSQLRREIRARKTVAGLQWGYTASGFATPAPDGAERLEYYAPGDWVFSSGYGHPYGGAPLRGTARLAAGSKHRIVWGAAVSGPGTPTAQRTGDTMDIDVPMFSDTAGHTGAVDPNIPNVSGSSTLYRDGKQLAVQNSPGRAVFTVPMRESDYRLVSEVTRDRPWWPLSTKVSAAWTFRSGFVQGRTVPLPLLTIRHAPQVDLANTAPGGREFSFPVSVHRQGAPADVRKLSVDVSYDDGKTWVPAEVKRDGDSLTATVKHPAVPMLDPASRSSVGFASLRSAATDADGNTVEQTIIRAYRISG